MRCCFWCSCSSSPASLSCLTEHRCHHSPGIAGRRLQQQAAHVAPAAEAPADGRPSGSAAPTDGAAANATGVGACPAGSPVNASWAPTSRIFDQLSEDELISVQVQCLYLF